MMSPQRATQSPGPQLSSVGNGGPHSMNLTFISIHDLSPEARILYSSESIIDVLGYTPDEIVNRSVWDFFPPEELPYAKEYHKHGIDMDKAAMLAYCRVKNSDGEWVGCECCFTIVYDVMVVCTSIYRGGMSSDKRALEAPLIRKMFSSSPLDPRYHMLSHISHKFKQPAKPERHEPRAALFLNRFTRTLTIMYATSGIEDILGVPSSALQGKSFYYCIAENCLSDAVRCLETAKGNDSIAYMRFWYRDPQQHDPDSSSQQTSDDSDEEMTTDTSVDGDMDGGVNLRGDIPGRGDSTGSTGSTAVKSESSMEVDNALDDQGPQSRTSSGDSTTPADTHEAIFGTSRPSESSASSAPVSPDSQNPHNPVDAIELEAVVSCASDGLVVCLRRARPIIPHPTARPSQPMYENGLFAAPWADEPMVPPISERARYAQSTTFAPSLSPHGARQHIGNGGPERQDFMSAIRDQAIFAWALTGINGSLHHYGSGKPLGESVPSAGLPVWQNDNTSMVDSMNTSTSDLSGSSAATMMNGSAKVPTSEIGVAIGNDHRNLFGDPGVKSARQQPSKADTTMTDRVGSNSRSPD